jgi:Holliday junction resolvase RusA-like endonuclease
MTEAVVRFHVAGIPQPKGSARAFLPRGAKFPVVTSDNPKLKGWEHTIRQALHVVVAGTPRDTLAAIYDGPVLVALDFALVRPASLSRRITQHVKRPDVDKLTRGAIDAMTGVLFRDDSQVVEVRARKRYADTSAGVAVRVERVW